MVNFITRFFARLSAPGNKPPKRKTITTKEAAKRLNLTKKSMHNLVYRGKIEAVKVGRRWAIYEDAVHIMLPGPHKKLPTSRRRLIPEIRAELINGAKCDEIAERLNALGFGGPRGGEFSAKSVSLIIKSSQNLRALYRVLHRTLP
jgi:excisionase family DNA binding protein